MGITNNTITTNKAFVSSSSTLQHEKKKEKAKAEMSSSTTAFGRLYRKLSPKKEKEKQKKKKTTSDLSPVVSNSDYIATICGSEQHQRVFRYFDENGDGKVSPAELRSCVRKVGGENEELSLEEAEGAVSAWDMDGDGLLGFDEFEKMILIETTSQEQKNYSELREAFQMYEMEGSGGCITPTSLKRMLNRLGESRSLEDCKSIIRFFDLNGDGVLCFHEFSTMMR